MKKYDKLKKQYDDLRNEIAKREPVRDLPEVKETLRKLHGQLSYVKAEINRYEAKSNKLVEVMSLRYEKANYNRSEKNKRNWRYAKAIYKNYPEYFQSLKEVRSAIKKRKQGLDLPDVPDAVWANPSP